MTAITLPQETALIVVDVQKGFTALPYQGKTSSTPEAISNISTIIATFRTASLPVIHIRHHSTSPNSPFHPTCNPTGIEVLPEAAELPGETLFVKEVNSSFIGTGLEQHLRNGGIKTLVVVGLTTSHCVSTTVRMAGNLGWEVFVPRDAVAMYGREAAPGAPLGMTGFDAQALAELHGEFATVVRTEQILRAVECIATKD